MSQRTWETTLRWAAHHGHTLKAAVIRWQKLMHTTAYPSGVSPEPKRELLGQKVAALWPEFTNQPWQKT